MKIMHSNLTQQARHQAYSSLERHGMSLPTFLPPTPVATLPAASVVSLSDEARSAQAAEQTSPPAQTDTGDPTLSLIRSLLERATGESFRVFNPRELETHLSSQVQAQAQNWQQLSTTTGTQATPRYRETSTYREYEYSRFTASGVVVTEDGQELQFDLTLELEYRYEERRQFDLQPTPPEQKDPLVLNFEGTAAQLSERRFAFDLDSDGQAESISRLLKGSGFLVFDRNHDGRANNGQELFGAATGDGFGELSLLDDDANGWIDEGDSAYDSLYLWQGAGENLQSLEEADVGAISTRAIRTPFTIRDSLNASLGQLAASSIFLRENGNTGTIQKIDFTV